jgi:hypothetical protein
MAPVNVMLQEIDRIQEQPFLLNRQALMPKLEAERTMLGHQTTVNQLTREWVDVSDALVAEDRPREIGQLQARLRVIESELKLLVPKANMDYMPSDYQ